MGISDLESETTVVEVKVVEKYHHALGQVLSYNFVLGKRMLVHLFGSAKYWHAHQQLITGVCQKYNVTAVYEANVQPDGTRLMNGVQMNESYEVEGTIVRTATEVYAI